jgi:hypothetical protein
MKVENYVGVPSGEDSIGMKTDEVCIPSTFSITEVESKVRKFLADVCVLCVHVYTHSCTCVFYNTNHT